MIAGCPSKAMSGKDFLGVLLEKSLRKIDQTSDFHQSGEYVCTLGILGQGA